MSDVIIYQGAAIPFSFSRQNGQPLDVTSVMRTLADITTYAANTEKKYVPYEGQTIACLEDKMLYILELKNGVLVPKLSGGVKLIKRDDNVELTDDAALSALRSVKEIEERAISRTKRDTAAEVIEFAKGLTAGSGKTTVSGDGKITTLNLLIQALAEMYDLNVSHVATMMRTIIKDYVSSEAFTPGLTGEGFKISKALNGDWNLEIDNIVVRKVMTIFEMVISKVRSVNGGLVISPANGRIKSVAETTGSPAYYVIGIEGDMQFVVDDYVRCQVFSNGHAKFYCVRVSSISGNSILVLKSEFTNGAAPAVGDDLVQMGNKTNTARQGLIYLTASEDGKPRISVMDGVNSTSLVGKNKVILGCLDGITDTDFPADFQPSGYGLYAMNVFLKGIFLLRNGKSVEGEIEAAQNAAATAQAKADMVTRLFQEFTVAGGLFESKITEVKEYADGKVNAVQIGGRNLIKNSQSLYLDGTDYAAISGHLVVNLDGQMVGKVSRKAIGSSETCYWYVFYTNNMSTPVKANTTYVWSLDVRSNCDGNVFFDVRNKYDSQFRVRFKSTSDKWIRISGIMDIADLSDVDRFGLFLVGVNGSNVGDYVYYRNPMIVEGNKTTDWTPAPEDVTADAQAKADDAKQAAIDDAANKYPTKSEFSTSITQLSDSISLKANQTEVTGLDSRLSSAEAKITPDAIRLTVSEQTKNIAIEYANLSAKLAGAKMLYRDPTFKVGLNGISVYNNFGGGIGINRLGRDPNNPTDSNYQIVITSTGYSQTPGRGGFYFGNPVHIYGEYICKIIAWIPVGSNLCFASNSLGDGGYQKWLTPTAGQGKWTEYVSYVRGGSGNTSTTNFYYLDAGAETLQWWLCYATVFECSSAEDTPTRSEVSAELDILSTEIRAKVSQTDFNALGQRVGSAESTITQQATQISAQVTAVNDLTGRVASAELALNPDNIWLGIKNNVAASIPFYTTSVDARSLDPNKYYLVTIGMATQPFTIIVGRGLRGDYGVPSYATHASGFSVMCKWQSNGSGWGASNVKRIIQTLEYRFVDSCPVGSIGQILESSEEHIYVRGGSIYDIRIDGISSATVTLRTSTYTPYPDYPNCSRPSPIDSVVTPVVDLDQKVTEEQVKTGISIAGNEVSIFGTTILNGNLIAGIISATDITTGRLTVTDGAKIGGMVIENNMLKGGSMILTDGAVIGGMVIENNTLKGGSMILTEGAVVGGFTISKDNLDYSLINNDLSSKIEITASNNRYLRIGGKSSTMMAMRLDAALDGYGNEGLSIQSYGANNVCLSLIANAGSAYSIRSFGSHVFGQRNGEKWNAPGVLWCGHYSCSNWNPTLVRSWGDGLGLDSYGNRVVPTISRSKSGCYTITHNLGHTDYYVHAIGNAQIRDNWNWWNTTVGFLSHAANSFALQFKDDGGGEKDPAEFQVMIFGRNKW